MPAIKIFFIEKQQKITLIKRVQQYILLNQTEDAKLLTGRLMRDMSNFIDGFFCCLRLMGAEPMPIDEILDFLFIESVEWIKERLEYERNRRKI